MHAIAHRALRARTSPGPAGSPWDRRADSWDEVAATPAFQRLARQVGERAAPSPGDRVVDLGAGTGLLTLALAPAVARVTAVDSSPVMLDRLTAKAAAAGLTNVGQVLADIRNLPLPDESATLVVSSYAFHHLSDADKALALSEARRVLAPGGRLVICDMMFGLTLGARDRRVIAEKLVVLARRGPAGLARIARNAWRLLIGRWEQPASLERWAQMLADRHFEEISVRALEHESGLASARRPSRRSAPSAAR